MSRLLAFDQIELLLNELEKFWIDFGVYKLYAESNSPPEQLADALRSARIDPQKLAEAQSRFGNLRKELREMAEHFATSDIEQGCPPSNQTN